MASKRKLLAEWFLVDLLGYIANRKRRLEAFKGDVYERKARIAVFQT